MGEPTKFTPMDMQELLESGVLMAANEKFFWPLGMALTWTVEEGEYIGFMHVRQWVDENDEWCGEHIELAADDEIGVERKRRFSEWLAQRLDKRE